MFKLMFLGLALVGGIAVAPFAQSSVAAPCVCCGEGCTCESCACDEKQCACDVGGPCQCSDQCNATCCTK
ncbi:hypothetical protein Poly24_45130 [Rosistilla carotiformis]|uniref:Metallothionein n=1 Tax=Rosistilla carotiformis TaxID=2528017 RepID=A0A518JZ20_9BACT|nr:hypothetical protein Poly24_45130 [Rosistilla carotiformis]